MALKSIPREMEPMPEETRVQRLLMNRQNLEEMRVDESGENLDAQTGEVVFKLDRFALTTNNITYAVYGDAMNYWSFFPVDASGWGQLPVWGYADVIASNFDEIEPGQRYFGYFPAASHLRVRPGKTSRASFRDDSPHRQQLPEVYNWYQRTDADPFHAPDTEPLHAIYRPLFITAFSLADFLEDSEFFGARRVLISSASSKTAYATAFCLRDSDRPEIVGLSSAANHEFVERTGLYHRVLDYSDLEQLDTESPTLYVDIAGNPDLTHRVHHHLADRLVYGCTVGAAQSVEPATEKPDLPGPEPRFFFAPPHIARRYQDWGVAEFNRRAGEATTAFYQYVTHPDRRLLTVTESRGLASAQLIIADMLQGEIDPGEGHVVCL